MYKKIIIAALVLIIVYLVCKQMMEKKSNFQVFAPAESYGQRWKSRAGWQGITTNV